MYTRICTSSWRLLGLLAAAHVHVEPVLSRERAPAACARHHHLLFVRLLQNRVALAQPACIHASMCVCVCVYVYTYIHTYIHTCNMELDFRGSKGALTTCFLQLLGAEAVACVATCMYVCVYEYVCMHVWLHVVRYTHTHKTCIHFKDQHSNVNTDGV